MLRIIERNSIYALSEEKVLVFDKSNQLIYSSLDDFEAGYSPELLDRIRHEEKVQYTANNFEHVGLVYNEGALSYVVIASAYDRYGRSKLDNLRTVILAGLLLCIGIIILAGRFFAGEALRPLAKMNSEIREITAGNLDRRVADSGQSDEIGQLAQNFNEMLQRLETAFEMQRQFVSNASHELRTPLATVISQLQVTLDKERDASEYRHAIQSVLDDVQGLVALTNGLLSLAQSELQNKEVAIKPVRVDEILYTAQDDLSKNHPDYRFQIEYIELPEEEEALTVRGNENLLRTAFLNFMDNACKFSPDRSVQVAIAFPGQQIEIRFSDRGIGIPPAEAERIFEPFYRAQNAHTTSKGHGIGLSLCRRIVQLHGGSIRVESTLGKGSSFVVNLPQKNAAARPNKVAHPASLIGF
jgi:signal transduction histidine kinase